MQDTGLATMLDLGGIKKNISEIEERIVNERRDKNRRQQQVVFLLDRIETHFKKQQEELNSAHQKIDRLEAALQEIAGAVEKLAGKSKEEVDEHDEVLERVLDLDRKFHTKPEATQREPQAEHSVHPLPADRTLFGKSSDYRAGERTASQQSAMSPYADPDHVIPVPAASTSGSRDQDEATLARQLDPEAERATAQRAGQHRPWEKTSFGAPSERSSSEDAASEHVASEHAAPEHAASEHASSEHAGSERWSSERAASDKHGTEKEPEAARRTRPDFSPDIRAIKALLNRDSSSRAGRESA